MRLAYSPPYHSQYHAVARGWGSLETPWNGRLLDAIDAVLQCAGTMTGQGHHPVVDLVPTPYQTGVTLTKEAMAVVDAQIERLSALGKWFVDIRYTPAAHRDTQLF